MQWQKTKDKLVQASLADASVHEFPRHLRDHLVMEAVTIARYDPVTICYNKNIHAVVRSPNQRFAQLISHATYSQTTHSDRTGWKTTT